MRTRRPRDARGASRDASRSPSTASSWSARRRARCPRAPVRVLAPGHPAATHRLFVRAGDRWRFDCRLGPAEVGDCAERTLRAQLGHALGGDPSPRGLSAEAHRARCREHRATRGA